MAGALGTLLVDIGASTARLERDLAKARGDLNKWANGVTNTMKGLGAAVGAAFTVDAFKNMVTSTLDSADAMAKLSQAVGVGVADLTAYRHAANLSGVSLEGVGTALKRLSKGMAETAQGSGTARDAFKSLGVAVANADGTLRDSDAVLLDIADRFKGMQDGAGKTAVAMELFGKAGADMIPMLNGGAKGLAEMKNEAKRLGLVFDTQTAQAAERINDNFTRLQGAFTGTKNQIVVGMLPTLENLTNMMQDTAGSTRDMENASKTLAAGLKLLATGGLVVGDVFSTAGRVVGGAAAAMAAVVDGEFSQAKNILEALSSDVKTDFSDSFETIKRVWADGGEVATSSAVKIQSAFVPVVASAKDAAKEVGKAYDELSAKIQGAAFTLMQRDTRQLESDTEGALEAFQGFALTLDTTGGALAQITEGLKLYNHETDRGITATRDIGDTGKTVYQEMQTAVSGWASNFSATLADAVWSAKVSFSEILESFGKMLTQMAIQKSIVEPMLKSFGMMPATVNAQGNVFDRGRLQAFAAGGVVNRPTLFPMARGMGLMGEAGPEAIMPLKRTASGDLGVQAMGGGGNITVNLIEAPGKGGQVKQSQEKDGMRLDLFVESIMKAAFNRGSMDKSLAQFGVSRVGVR